MTRLSLLFVSVLWRLDAADAANEVNTVSGLIQNVESETEQDDPPPRNFQAESIHQRYLKVWLPQSFPNPATTESPICWNGRICDPDSVLTLEEMESLVALVQTFENNQTVPCATSVGRTSNKDQVDAIPVQLAIAMVKKMDLSFFGRSDNHVSHAAELFCRSLHDRWGVGYDVPSCGGGTGILIFFSVLDRALFISRGGALDTVLTDARLDRIINRHMKPRFRQQLYSDGLKEAVDQIGVYVQQGRPSLIEILATNWQWCLFFLFCAGKIWYDVWDAWRKKQARQQYARVADQLRQLDRAKAEALQGQYHSTSCPICLEDFQVKPAVEPKVARNKRQLESTKPLKTTKHRLANLDDVTPISLDLVKTADMLGSDGLPLKLLRCGHVFDETCWKYWVSKAQSNSRCPICRENVDEAWVATPANEGNSNDAISLMEQQNEGAMRQYQSERHFRLTRLASRYPRFVRHHHIHWWSHSTYDGALAQDANFLRTDPGHQITALGHSTSGRGGSNSFGGGFSSGGRGGRW